MADKKPAAKKKAKGLWGLYEKKGDSVTLKNRVCPKCTVIMAQHKDRVVCGKCKYTEFLKK